MMRHGDALGRVFYSFSSYLCVPNALSQEGGYALGAQAGESRVHACRSDTVQRGYEARS